jgi:hypothetical protein
MPESFSWSENFDENVNFWFWLRRKGLITDSRLVEEARQSLHRHPVENHERVAKEASWQDYLHEWRTWKRDQALASVERSRSAPQKARRAHYRAVADVGLPSLRVEWVMAPFGQRWLFPPDVAVLGVESGTAEQLKSAVVDAARALRERSA